MSGYVELQVTSHFSFLRGASSCEELFAHAALLAIPALGLCFPAIYARSEPSLLGWPFFYWYQFAWIILSGVITAVVYFATSKR